MKTIVKDGWHKVYTVWVYTEDGIMKRATNHDHTLPVHLYRYNSKWSMWVRLDGLTLDQIRSGCYRGTMMFF